MAQARHMQPQLSSASGELSTLQQQEVLEKQKQPPLDSLCSQQTTLKKCRPFFKQPHHPNNVVVTQKNQFLDRSQGISPTLCSPSDSAQARDNQNAVFFQCLKKQSMVKSISTTKSANTTTTAVIDGPVQQVSSLASPRQQLRNENSSSSCSSQGKNNNISSEEDGRFDYSPRFQDSKSFKQLNSQHKQYGTDSKGSADKTIAKISRLLYLSDEKQENLNGKETVDRLFERTQYNRIPLQPFAENICDIQSHSQPPSGTKNNNNSSIDRGNTKNEPTEECPYLQSSGKKQQYFFTTPNKHEAQFFTYGSASQALCNVSGNNYFKPKPFGSPNQSPRQRYQEGQLFKPTYPADDAIEKRQGRIGNSSSEQKGARQFGQSSFASLPDRCVADYDCSMDYSQQFHNQQYEPYQQTKQQQQVAIQSFYSINSQQFFKNQSQQINHGSTSNNNNSNLSNSIISGYYQDNLPSQLVQDVSVGGDIFPAGSSNLSSSFRNISSIQPQQQQPQKFFQQLMVFEEQRQQQQKQQSGLFPAQNLSLGYQLGSHVSFGQRSSQQQMYPNNSIPIGYSSDNSIQNNNTNSHINFDDEQEFSQVGNTHDPSEVDEQEEEEHQSCRNMKLLMEANICKTEQELQKQQISHAKKEEKQTKQKKYSRQSIKLSDEEVVILNEAPKKRRANSKAKIQNIQQQLQPQLPRQCTPPSKLEKKSTADLQKSKKPNKKKTDIQLNDDSEDQTREQENNSKGQKGVTRNKFDTKNLVKNFLNQFLSFASSTDPKEQSEVCSVLGVEKFQLTGYQERLRQFLKHSKYNRQLFKEFIHVEQFRVLFSYFLQHKAQAWIENGRMKDKLSHFRALSNFTYISENHDTVKSWRFRYNFV